jgi:hypothetical protein
MKKYFYLIIIVLISSLVLTGCLLSNVGQVPATSQTKVKPEGLGGAQTYAWHLSGALMPSPPWGLSDISGSDTASKLIVNQPNGNVEVAVTGVMNGLHPNTVYTVYPSNEWSTSEKWNIVGDWSLRFMYGGAYDHDMTVTFQNMYTGVFSGTGYYITDPSTTWIILGTSKVVGNTIYLDLQYTGSSYTVNAQGTINTNGAIIDGTWLSNANQSGAWSSTSGQATKKTVGNGYPGLFLGQETLTFLTDEYGAGSWHFNLKNDDFNIPGTYSLSVWINEGGTILISDNFEVIVN